MRGSKAGEVGRSRSFERLNLLARPTRAGWILIGLAAMVALAALNTGANLLFIVLSLQLAVLVRAMLAGRGVLEGLQLRLSLPGLVEAHSIVRGQLDIEGECPSTMRVLASGWLPEGGLLVEGPPDGGNGRVVFYGQAPSRGVVRQVPLLLVTRAPYDLFERRHEVEGDVSVHIHPRWPAPVAVDGVLRDATGRDVPAAGEDGSLRDLRDFQPGDNRRHVHWRASARIGSLQVRRFHAERRPRLQLEVDPRGLDGEALEALLEKTAGRLRDGLQAGFSVDLELAGERTQYTERSDLGPGLRALSRVPAVTTTAGTPKHSMAGSG